MNPDEAVKICEARARMLEDLIARHKRGEIELDCPECRQADVEEYRGIAGAIVHLQSELEKLKSLEAKHRSLVGDYADETTKLRGLLDILAMGIYSDRIDAREGFACKKRFLTVNLTIVARGDDEISAVEEWLKGRL